MTDSEIHSLRSSYLAAYPRCHLTAAVGRYVRFHKHVHSELCVHHIFGRGKGMECWSNYATVLPAPHEWAHDNPVMGRISLLHYKWRLGGKHFDEWSRRKVGQVEVWLETAVMPDWCRRMGEELVRGNQ